MNTIQIIIEASEQDQEILISQLADHGAEGFEQTEAQLIAYFNPVSFDSYEVNQLVNPYPHRTVEMEERNWNEVWESNFQPVVVDDFCAIRAEFHQAVPGVEHEIIITPKMSFGTGHHATTYMMIAQMRDINFGGKEVFDFGTGTGILAILAEKLGAASITAIDVDDWSIANANENLQRNGCSKTSVSLSSQIPQRSFDIILANINRNVILQYLPQLRSALRSRAQLLLSGLLTTDEETIHEACKNQGLSLTKKMERNNWISLLFDCEDARAQ